MDLFNLDETSKFIEKNRPDVVINAAAKVGGIVANNTQRLEFILENLKINMNILESLKDFRKIKFINLGSSCIYPLNAKSPIKEDRLMTGGLEPTNSPYAMAKLTAIEIGDALSKEFGPYNIRVNAVAPGPVNTEMFKKNTKEENIKKIIERTATRKIASTRDVANLVSFLASNVSSHINGEIINIDGGLGVNE